MKKYDISLELFRAVNKDLTEEDITFCYNTVFRYDTVLNIFFFKCLDYARSEEMFLNITDYQHYYVVNIKDYENDYEPHSEFKSTDLKEAVFNACEFIHNFKG